MKVEFKRWKNLSEIIPEPIELFVQRYSEREPILLEIEEFAKENKVPILLPSSAILLRFLVSALKPKKILEIGTGIGYSTLHMFFANKKSQITTVDVNRKRTEIARRFFEKAKAYIEILEEDAFDAVRKFLAEDEKFDLIFVDVGKSEYVFFNYKVQALLTEKGMAIFDNVLFRGYVATDDVPQKYVRSINLLKKFLEDIKEYPNFESFLVPVGDGLLILRSAC